MICLALLETFWTEFIRSLIIVVYLCVVRAYFRRLHFWGQSKGESWGTWPGLLLLYSFVQQLSRPYFSFLNFFFSIFLSVDSKWIIRLTFIQLSTLSICAELRKKVGIYKTNMVVLRVLFINKFVSFSIFHLIAKHKYLIRHEQPMNIKHETQHE